MRSPCTLLGVPHHSPTLTRAFGDIVLASFPHSFQEGRFIMTFLVSATGVHPSGFQKAEADKSWLVGRAAGSAVEYRRQPWRCARLTPELQWAGREEISTSFLQAPAAVHTRKPRGQGVVWQWYGTEFPWQSLCCHQRSPQFQITKPDMGKGQAESRLWQAKPQTIALYQRESLPT